MFSILKGTLFIVWVLGCSAVGAVVKLFDRAYVLERMLPFCYRHALKLLGVTITVESAAAPTRPLLLVTNHTSYLDVLVIASIVPVAFTPKVEIASWPVVGSLCRLIDCVFIDRNPRKTAENEAAIRAELMKGRVVSLFPEGTTNDGKRVLPFNSSYFRLAEETFDGKKLTIQPAVISYTHVCNLPMDVTQRPRVAWYGDMKLMPHFRQLLKLGPIRGSLRFLQPVDISVFSDRKALAAHCQQAIQAAYNEVIS